MIFFENTVFPDGCKGILDVTKPPYCLDNTGVEDCSEKLCNLLDSLLQSFVDDMRLQYEILMDAPEGTRIGETASRRENGRILILDPVIDRAILPTIYFPNGTYLLTDTVSYRLQNLKNYMYHYTSGGCESASYMRFLGQSREKTITTEKSNA